MTHLQWDLDLLTVEVIEDLRECIESRVPLTGTVRIDHLPLKIAIVRELNGVCVVLCHLLTEPVREEVGRINALFCRVW